MARVSRSRRVAAPPERVWDLVSDPHSLPRWWPRTIRVEDVTGRGSRMRWTAVLGTQRGSGLRADFRCIFSRAGELYAWAQEVEGTPFERILRHSSLEIRLEASDGQATVVRMVSDESLRGLARFGAFMVRGATRRRLDEALDGIELALVGEPAR